MPNVPTSQQLSLVVDDDAGLLTVPVSPRSGHADIPQPRTTYPTGYRLDTLADQFLQHLAVSRRCSPRTVAAYASDYRKTQRLLVQAGHNLDVRVITTGDLQVVIGGLGHLASTSVERIIYSLSSLFRYLVRQGVIAHSPVDQIDRPQRQRPVPRSASREEVRRLLAACRSSQERLVLSLLAFGGLRRAELLGADAADLGADLMSLRVRGKGRRERVIPLHATLQPLLVEHLQSLDPMEGPLVRNEAGKRMSSTTLWRLFDRLLRAAGLGRKALSPHALRHHFASQLVRSGADIATVAELLGHSNISTTSIYLHSDSATKREAINRLPVHALASEGAHQ